ncbi:MAG TPA: hypothetical protein VNZ58_00085 [Thermomicrobiales bacterium]|nr:hypothetical protein [Thermomicrobiales bacterium]
MTEKYTNTDPRHLKDDTYSDDLARETPKEVRQQELEAEPGSADKTVGRLLPELTNDQLSRLSILEPGTPLEQGSVYLDLNDPEGGPFKAIGGQEAGTRSRLIAKNMTDYDLWNEIAGRDDTPTIERPS